MITKNTHVPEKSNGIKFFIGSCAPTKQHRTKPIFIQFCFSKNIILPIAFLLLSTLAWSSVWCVLISSAFLQTDLSSICYIGRIMGPIERTFERDGVTG